MTISTTTVKVTVAGNGVQTVFNYSFLMPTAGQYDLYLTDTDGTFSLIDQSDYTVSGIGNPNGGTFTYSPAISTGQSLTLVRDLPDTQTTNYGNQAAYYPQTVESTFDRTVMQIQDLAEKVSRAWLAPVIEGAKPSVPILSERAGLLAAWDESGNLVASDYSPDGTTLPHLTINGDQTLNNLPIANPVATLSSLLVTATTVDDDLREFMANFGMTSNKGSGTAGADKVTVYAGMLAEAGTGDVWSLNTVLTQQPSSGSYNALGFELDVNNLNDDRGDTPGFGGLFPPLSYGLVITGNNAFRHTAAIAILAAQPQTYNRGIVIDQSVMQASFQDLGIAERSLSLEGQFDIGLSMESGTFAIAPILLGNDTYINGLNFAADTFVPLLGIDFDDAIQIGSAGITSFVSASGDTIPSQDNTYSLGLLSNRWTEVFAANGTINTSGRAFKKDMKPLGSTMLDVVKAIQPQSFKMLVGGAAWEEYEEKEERPVTEDVTIERQVVKVVDGVARLVTETQVRKQKVYDTLPVLGDDGAQLMAHTDAKPAKYDVSGKVMLAPPVPAIDTPMVKRVPRMETVAVKKRRRIDRPGRRTHYGFAADDFKRAFEKLGLGDFGGYVSDSDGNEGLRSDQIVALLWQAVRELNARVEELEA